MADTSLNQLKKSALEFAAASAAKIESLTAAGKLRLDLLAEEHRLQEKYTQLGDKTYSAIQDAKFETLREDPYVIELLGAIGENKSRLEALRAKLNTAE